MRTIPTKLTRLVLLLAGAAYGCSEHPSPLEPAAAVPPSGPRYELLDPDMNVQVLRRTQPLPAPISVTQDISSRGGTIDIPGAGLSVIFPFNAVPLSGNQTVRITVTALAGDGVAYSFEPHGLRFNVPVRIVQDYRATEAFGNLQLLRQLEGAYFPDLASLDPASSVARIVETRPAEIDRAGSKVKFTIEHFSGYLVSSGRAN